MPLDKTSDQAALLNLPADEEKGKSNLSSELPSLEAGDRRTTAARATQEKDVEEEKEEDNPCNPGYVSSL